MTAVWTCPFCPLLCDDQSPSTTACPVARSALAQCASGAAPPRMAGTPVSLDDALTTATEWLARSRQPLVGGWGTDVAGARALVRLAVASDAITDAAGGPALTQALRVQQDHGGYTVTLGDVRQHADLIVMVGSWAPTRAPRLLERLLDGRTTWPALVHLGGLGGELSLAQVGGTPLVVQRVDLAGDLFETVARLQALVADRLPVGDAPADLVALAGQLRAARYAVLVWEPSQLGPHAALVIERLQRLIGQLNQTTRAAGFPLSGGQGGGTAQQVHTWMTGLPLRSRMRPEGLVHDPLRFDARTLIAAGEVDLVVWAASFPGMPVPAAPGLPRIVLGLPALGGGLGDEQDTVFIPVATPGVHQAGHLTRTDGVVTLPLHMVEGSDLPGVAEVVERLLARMEGSPA